uniref:Uncharacterized protein n=1 Tax=Salix viminalis TaxID=40686 RepID=A0A6N2N9H0_SALVM
MGFLVSLMKVDARCCDILFKKLLVIYFHDKFTWLKGVGLLIIMVGVGLFNWYKYQKLQKGQTSENDSAGFIPKKCCIEVCYP